MTETKMPTTCNRVMALYRVSTKGQVDKNDIPMQKQSCREFAQRQGWCIVKEFQEKGISGYKVSAENRDAMIELRKAAERKEFDILLVFMFDRIGRMDDETPYVVKWFIKHGIRVWSVVEGEQRMDNHVDKLMNYIRFWQANGESEKTSTRVKTRLSQMVQEGMYTGGNVPYGYKLVKSGQKNKKGKELMMVVIDEDEAPIIKSIFSMTLREGYGSYQIAKQLNEKGLRTHRGSKFQANTIRRILRNKMFCGYLIAGENESPHLPDLEIISENVFKQVQFIMDQRSVKDDEKKQIALRTKGKTQLSGNLYCGHCGRKLIATTHTYYYDRADGTRVKTVKQRYICTNSGRDRGICNGQGAYLAEKVDEVVLEVVRKYLDAIKVTPKSLTMEKQYKTEIADTKKLKKKVEAELEKLKKQSVKLSAEIGKVLIGESNYTSEMLTTSINIINQSIAEKENQIAEIESKLANQQDDIGKLDFYYDEFRSWADEFDLSTNEERKMIICKLIKQIRLYKGYQFEIDFDSDYKRFLEEFTLAS